METIQLQLDEQTVKRAQRLAASRGISLNDLVGALLAEAAEAGPNGGPISVEDPLWGMFGSEPELLDAVVADAMQARERDPLRLENG